MINIIGIYEILLIIYILFISNIYFINHKGIEIHLFLNDLNENLISLNEKNLLYLLFLNFLYFIIFKKLNPLKIKVTKGLEYYLLLIFNIFSINILILSNEFLLFLISLELYSFILYLFLLYKNTPQKSTISIIYLLINSISSSFIILAISFIYSSIGNLYFDSLPLFLNSSNNIIYISSFFLILFSFFFKLGLAPFQFWLIRTYSAITDNHILLYFIIIPKLIYIFFIFKFNPLYLGLSPHNNNYISIIFYLFILISFFSCLIGSIGGLFHNNINLLLTYSSILNLGFFFFSKFILDLYYHTSSSWYFNIFEFLFIYIINTLTLLLAFTIIRIDGLGKSFGVILSQNPFISFSILSAIFSFIGLPPFAGFFAKLNLFFFLILSFKPLFFIILLFFFFSTLISAFFYFKFLSPLHSTLNYPEIIPNQILGESIMGYILSFLTIFLPLYPLFYFYIRPFYFIIF